jgi:hypothetical protein
MIRLEDLLRSLVTTVIRYPDNNMSRQAYQERAETLLLKLTDEYKNLEDRISTLPDKTRSPLFQYFIHEIKFLKEMLDRKNSFNTNELLHYKQQITQMLMTFKNLLLKTKTESLDVKYSIVYSDSASSSSPSVTLLGTMAVPNAITGTFQYLTGAANTSLCNSGTLLKEELLDLNIKASSSEQELQQLAHRLCQDLQDRLLLPELKAQIENSPSQETVKQLNQDLQTALGKNKELEAQITNSPSQETVDLLNQDLQAARERNRELEEAVLKLQQQVKIQSSQERENHVALMDENREQKSVIARLKAQVANLTKEHPGLQPKAASSSRAPLIPSSPLYSPPYGAPFSFHHKFSKPMKMQSKQEERTDQPSRP